MASEERIDSYIDRQAIQSDTDFFIGNIKEVQAAYKSLKDIKVNFQGVGSSKQLLTELANLQRANERVEKTAQAVIKTRRESALAMKAEAQAAEAETKAKIQQIKLTSDLGKEKEKIVKQMRDEQKVAEEVANDYLQLSKAYNDAALKAKNYALRLGESNPITVEAVKQAKAMYDVLYRVDKAVGQNQRNVGNYKSAFDGLGMSFTQVARELPSLGISVQQFALAISNNLPMVVDEIGKAKDELAALKAEGKEAPSIFQRVGASLISWQVGISVAIALLTTLGPKLIDWASGLIKGGDAAKEATEKQNALNDATRKAIDLNNEYYALRSQNFGNLNRDLETQILYLRAQGAEEGKILELEKQLARERQVLAQTNFVNTGGVRQLDELGDALKNAKQEYEAFLNARTITDGTNLLGEAKVLKPGDEKYDKQEAQLKRSFDIQKQYYEDQKAVVEEYYNANRDAAAKDLELQKYFSDQRIKFFAGEMQYRADNLKELSKFEGLKNSQQVELRKAAYEIEKSILTAQRNEEVIDAKGKANEIVNINRKYNLDRVKLADKLNADLLTLRQDYIIKQKEAEKEATELFQQQEEGRADASLQILVKEKERRIAYIEEAKAFELAALERKRQANQINDQTYQVEQIRLENKYAAERLKVEIDYTENVLNLAKMRGEDVSKQEAQLADLKLQYLKASGAQQLKVLTETDKAEKELLEQKKKRYEDMGRELLEVLGSVITANFDRQKNAIQEQIDLLEEKKQKDIEVANSSIANEQDRAAAIITIQARSNAEKEKLERQQRQLDQQKARFEKLGAILQIEIDTIQKVAAIKAQAAVLLANPLTAPLAPIALAQIPLVLVSGALSATAIAAKPVPKYRTGRKGGAAELAIVGDGGVSEVLASPDGSQAFLTPDRDTLAYIPKGWNVHKSPEDFLKSANSITNKTINAPAQPAAENVGQVINGQFRELRRAIESKRENYISLKNGEFKTAVKQGGAWTEYINRNVYE